MLIDSFGQEINIGDNVVFANNKSGRGQALETCTVDNITDKDNITLIMDDWSKRITSKPCSLGIAFTLNKQLEVDDYVIGTVEFGQKNYELHLFQVINVSEKMVKLRSLIDTSFVNGDMSMQKQKVLPISEEEMNRLKALKEAHIAKQDAEMKSFVDMLTNYK